MILEDFRKWALLISANEPYVRPRVQILACISIAGVVADLLKTRRWVQWSPVELVRLVPCRPGLDM